MPRSRPNPTPSPKLPDSSSAALSTRTWRVRLRSAGTILAALAIVASVTLILWRVEAKSGTDRTHTDRVAAGAPIGTAPDNFTGAITDGKSIITLYDFLMGHFNGVVSLSLTATAPTYTDLKSTIKSLQLDSLCSSSTPPSNCPLLLGQKGVRFMVKNAGVIAKSNLTYANGIYTLVGNYQIGAPTLNSKGYYIVPIAAVPPSSDAGAGDTDEDPA